MEYLVLSDTVDLEDSFRKTANYLLNESVLKVNGKSCRIMEIEFYLRCDAHDDKYVHGNKDQLTCGKFYFHKFGPTYKGGTYKGVDITFNYGTEKNYGGILIRSLYDLDEKKFVEGSCNCVTHMLKLCGKTEIKEFVDENLKEGESLLDVFETPILHLEPNSQQIKQAIIASPRVGLSPGHEDFLFKNYRYANYSNTYYPKKCINQVVCALHLKGLSVDEITEKIYVSKTKAREYIDYFKDGQASTNPEKEKFKTVPGFCRYMGFFSKTS